MVGVEVMESIGDNVLMFFPLFYRKLMKGWDRSGKKPPLSQYQLLGRLMWKGPLPMSELGRNLCISKPNMSSLIDRLVTEGKVLRLSEEKDHRVIKIIITKEGRQFMKEHKKLMKQNISRNLSSLSEKDLRTLCASMENMKEIISKISDEE